MDPQKCDQLFYIEIAWCKKKHSCSKKAVLSHGSENLKKKKSHHHHHNTIYLSFIIFKCRRWVAMDVCT